MTEMSECDRGHSVKRRGHVRLDWTCGDKPRHGSSSSLYRSTCCNYFDVQDLKRELKEN